MLIIFSIYKARLTPILPVLGLVLKELMIKPYYALLTTPLATYYYTTLVLAPELVSYSNRDSSIRQSASVGERCE